MPATLTIAVSDAALARLTERAAALGTTPEAVLAADVEQTVPLSADALAPAVRPGDLLRKWIGAFESGVPDMGSRHDVYIGQALLDELRGKPND